MTVAGNLPHKHGREKHSSGADAGEEERGREPRLCGEKGRNRFEEALELIWKVPAVSQ
jgi:hypothetical protein